MVLFVFVVVVVFLKWVIVGLVGIFIVVMMVGLNNCVGVLVLVDVCGVLGFGLDDVFWFIIVYSVGEVIVMLFLVWFVIIFLVC